MNNIDCQPFPESHRNIVVTVTITIPLLAILLLLTVPPLSRPSSPLTPLKSLSHGFSR